MKKPLIYRSFGAFLLVSALLAGSSDPASARMGAGDLGIGVYAPNPIGVTAKYWLNSELAVAVAAGAQDNEWTGHIDILAHLPELLPQPKGEKRLPAYLGLGLKGKDESPNLFGIRFIFGVAYHARYEPLELFAEVGPVLRVDRGLKTDIDGGGGLRYYFTLNRKEDGLIRPHRKRRSKTSPKRKKSRKSKKSGRLPYRRTPWSR